MRRTINVYAPQALNGIMPVAPQGCRDVYHEYPFDVTLAANQVLPGQLRSIDTDSDFLLRALVFTSTSDFSVRLWDASGFYLSDREIRSAALSNDGGRPYVYWPEVVYPRGSAIGIDLTELTGFQNVVQLVFRGAKRYTT